MYEPLFHENSYGFRPGRGCHDAIEALHGHLSTHEVETILDVDLSNYFGSIPQETAVEIIKKKISDPRILRYLIRRFKSGLLVDVVSADRSAGSSFKSIWTRLNSPQAKIYHKLF
ncbi:MAG: reverse transcriptase domain-containing protein [Legionella sp.]